METVDSAGQIVNKQANKHDWTRSVMSAMRLAVEVVGFLAKYEEMGSGSILLHSNAGIRGIPLLLGSISTSSCAT